MRTYQGGVMDETLAERWARRKRCEEDERRRRSDDHSRHDSDSAPSMIIPATAYDSPAVAYDPSPSYDSAPSSIDPGGGSSGGGGADGSF